MHVIDMVGFKSGRLEVIERAERPPYTTSTCAYWKCKCKCGNECVVSARALRAKITQSCGCLSGDKNRIRRGIKPLLPV